MAEQRQGDWKAVAFALAIIGLFAFLLATMLINKGGGAILIGLAKWIGITAVLTAGAYFTVLIFCGGSALYNYGTKPGDERGCAGLAALVVFGICVWKGLFR